MLLPTITKSPTYFSSQGVSLNAFSPTLVTLLGMVTDIKLVQSENALSPMLVTPLGIVMLVSELHS
jgi:hypothetical protein